MSSIDQQFVEYIVKSVVSNPDAVVVTRTIDERGVLLELTVDPSDLGRVIGKRGSGAQALRTLLRALGTKNDARYNLKIVDNGEEAPRREDSNDRSEPNDMPEEESIATDEVESEESTQTSARAEQTRKELEDLDDLDI